MTTSGSSFNPTPLGHEDNLGVRYHPRGILHRPTMPILVYVILGAEMHMQMLRSSSQSEAKFPVFSSQARLGIGRTGPCLEEPMMLRTVSEGTEGEMILFPMRNGSYLEECERGSRG
ncbi:hypothetical protein TNCV_960031 [Trichonephila clavipes]|nr:hypothetical protein TNCV_960031 [Trichonephila clavipes]